MCDFDSVSDRPHLSNWIDMDASGYHDLVYRWVLIYAICTVCDRYDFS